MRYRALSIVMPACLAYAGCATTGGAVNTTTGPTVAQVQQAAVQACKFLPTADTAAQLIEQQTASGNTSVANDTALAQQLAALVCGAVQATAPTVATAAKASKRRLTIAVLNGVPISGAFVEGRFVK